MANTAENTFISYDAVLTQLPEGAAFPTTISEVLPVGSKALGYLDAGGETLAFGKSIESIRAHQNNEIVRNIITPDASTFAATAIEDTPDVRSLFYGSVEVDGVLEIDPTKAITGNFVYDTYDTADGFEKKLRLCFRATVTSNGDVVFAPGALTVYPLLFTIIGKAKRISSTEVQV